MGTEKLGTWDFYYDMADQLEELGLEFVLLVRPPGVPSVLNYNNIQNPVVASRMLDALHRNFDEKFGFGGGGI